MTRAAWNYRLAAALGIAASLVLAPAAAQQHEQQQYPADRVKAAFLYNFGSYVDWPTGREPREAFVISVLGADNIARDLREIAQGRRVQGRSVQVREINAPAEIAGSHIVFVGEKRAAVLPRVVAFAGDSPLLIVSDARNGLQMGATINFALVDRRVRFEVSMPAAKRAGLNLSSRLLAIAVNVERSGHLYQRPHIAGDARERTALAPCSAATTRRSAAERRRMNCRG